MGRLSAKAKEMADPESQSSLRQRVRDLEIELLAEKKKTKEAEARRAYIQDVAEEQSSRIEKIESSKFKFPKQTPGKTPKTFIRICIPDTHGSSIDLPAFSAFLSDLESLKPHEIILLGDHVDCGGFLAQAHTYGYVAQTSYTFEDDIAATNQMLDKVQAICPTAKIEYIEGNHEFRISRWCVTQASGTVRTPSSCSR